MPDGFEEVQGIKEEKLDSISNLTAEEIGGDVTGARIKRIIQASNTRGILFHGIKRNTFIEDVKQNGILPLTPESQTGGPRSYWTTGQSLFGDLKQDGSLQTYNTTFFHYAPAANGDTAYINIAVTDKDTLNGISPIMVPPDAHVEVSVPLLPNQFTLLRVPVDNNERERDPRNAWRLAERRMVSLLEGVIDGSIKMGEVVELDVASPVAA